MAAPVDASHWSRPLDRSYANFTVRDALVAAGFRSVGVVFYPPPKPAMTDDAILYDGSDGREYARRMREGHTNEVFVGPQGTAVAETDTRYGADLVWLATLFDNGRVIWTSNAPSRKPVVQFYSPDPDDMNELDDASRERLERMMGCFRVEHIVGDVDGALQTPHLWAGLDIQIVDTLDVPAMYRQHRDRVAATSGTAVPAEIAVLIAATERAVAVQRYREVHALTTAGLLVVGGWVALAALIWTTFAGAWFWAATVILGPLALLLGLVGFLMWPTRAGVQLAGWMPLPLRKRADATLAAIRARPLSEPPD